MKLILIAVMAVFADAIPYKTSLMVMATRYRAIHTCNCLYVMNMNEGYCKNFSKIDPPVFSVAINSADKSVLSGIDGMADFKPAVAKFTTARTGCKIITE